jgi:hypothetical protein
MLNAIILLCMCASLIVTVVSLGWIYGYADNGVRRGYDVSQLEQELWILTNKNER